jgi:hypothetical protein
MRDGPGVPPPATHRRDSETSARRFLYGSTVGITIAGAAFAWMVTGGTFQFFRSVPFSTFYDVQARSFLHGTWSMPARVLSIEGIRTGGRTDMYFGPVPALFRLPVLIFTHRLDGRLTEPSLLIGFVVALVFASLLSWRVRGMIRGAAPVSRFEAALTAAIIVVIGLGSVLFFLGATAQVYEEAEMWGAALALGSFYALVGFLNRPSAGRLVATGVLTTLALLTRGSVGAGPVVALGLAAAVYLLAWMATRVPRWQPTIQRLPRAFGIQVADPPGRFGVGLVAAMAIPVVLYVAINEIKFGTLFSIPLNRQVATLTNAHQQAVLAANGGSLFGLKFLPTNLLQFARPDALTLTRLFPWVFFPGKALVLGHLLYDLRDWTSSVPASMPVLFLLAVLGVVSVFRPARLRGRFARLRGRFAAPGSGIAPAGPEPATIEGALAAPGIAGLRLPLVGSVAGTAGMLVIAFIAERYLSDAMPMLLLAALPGWHVVMRRWVGPGTIPTPKVVRTVGAAVLVVLALFELWTTFSLSLFYQRELGSAITIPQRAGMVSFQEQVDQTLVGGPAPGVRFAPTLPTHAEALDLAVIGNCAGVYQFDGKSWQPVELGAHGGALLLNVDFPRTELGRRQPLLVTGGATPQDVVAVTWEGGDLYRFSYLFDGSAFGGTGRDWYTEPAVAVAPGQPHRVQVDLVTGLGQIYITVDGSPVFSLLYPVAPPNGVRLGSAPPSISTTPVFAGRVRSLPVPTPICNDLERRR